MTRGDSDSDEVVNSASAGSDVENVDLEDWGSEVSGDEIPVPEVPVPDMVCVRLTPAIRVALEWLDTVKLWDAFTRRAAVMKSVLHFLREPYRNAMRLAMEEATQLSQAGRNVGGDCFCGSRDSCCTGLPGRTTSIRTSWPNDSTISRLASGCSFCTQAGSAMRKLLWQCTGSGGGTLNRMRWRDELPVPSLWFKLVSCRQAARNYKVLLLRQAKSKLSIPSVTLSGGRHVPGIPFLVTYWTISRRFLSNWRSSSLW